MQNGFLSNGCNNSNVYGTTYSTTNGYGNGSLAAKPPLNAARASPRLSQGCGASPRSSVASYSSHTSGIGASPPMARRSPQSNKVSGGADQNYPVIVSRVAPGSSADKAHPRLNEGDQVLFINGRDVTPMSHDTVVDFIRSARTSPNGGELVLTIKPNVYRLGEEVDEPEGAALPEQMRVAESVPRSDKLSHSLRLLADALATGRIVSQFEQLYRKKPGMTMNDCRLTSNLNKIAARKPRIWVVFGELHSDTTPNCPLSEFSSEMKVRRARAGSVDPIVVHCSAGIGRTGVLILMETAACLVEANEPVYPLDIVRVMRDQRAMAIQTAGQYTFVCESILRAYNDGIIKPLAEYQKR
ncbi:Protein-tyrosine phosphatase [Ostertagia ostertagi]